MRPRIFNRRWHRWALAAVPAVSLTVLTPVPFIVAWRRRIVGWRTVATYTLLSAVTFGCAVADLDVRAWGTLWREVFRYALWAYMVTGVTHVALLGTPWTKRLRAAWLR
jgi:hypothetical protein